MPGLVGVLRAAGIEGVRYAPWGTTGRCHRDQAFCPWRSRATDGKKRVGRQMRIRTEKIPVIVRHEAHVRRTKAAMTALEEGPEGFRRSYLD